MYKYIWLILIVVLASCNDPSKEKTTVIIPEKVIVTPPPSEAFIVKDSVFVGRFFQWIDTISNKALNQDTLAAYILVHKNPFIIDRLSQTDYYYQKALGNTILDPLAQPVLFPGDTIFIPREAEIRALRKFLKGLLIDINIPEFKLRMYTEDSLLFEAPVRVGKNERKYLMMAGREINLQTRTGEGRIIRVVYDPCFINPVDNKPYSSTKRDDGIRTGLPNIPWLEPEINGERLGQLIHPTTNITTLGRPSSNGCIGLRESDAWKVYFHAPLHTRVQLRYNIEICSEDGSLQKLQDIYHVGNRKEDTISHFHINEEHCLCH